MAMRSLRAEDSRVLYVAYGETDHFAHEGHYDKYLDALHRVDGCIGELWAMARADPRRAGRTALIVTTDHGRGLADLENENWRRHGSGFDASPFFRPEDTRPGSDQIWVAYIGPRQGSARESAKPHSGPARRAAGSPPRPSRRSA